MKLESIYVMKSIMPAGYSISINEMSAAEIEANPPKYSEWRGDEIFNFDVEGDDCSPKWCYSAYFEEIKTNSYELEFRRLGNNSKDVRKGVGIKVIMAVMYAIMEFIKKKNPEVLSWSPVKTKTANPVTGQIKNPEGRRDVYDNFAIKSLLPIYVSLEANEWMRKDIYERDYVTKGYPPIPDSLTTASPTQEKKAFLQKIRAGAVAPI